jgi:hypothetical protein
VAYHEFIGIFESALAGRPAPARHLHRDRRSFHRAAFLSADVLLQQPVLEHDVAGQGVFPAADLVLVEKHGVEKTVGSLPDRDLGVQAVGRAVLQGAAGAVGPFHHALGRPGAAGYVHLENRGGLFILEDDGLGKFLQ